MNEIVAPCAGAWIEIATEAGNAMTELASLPVRERGLKLCGLVRLCCGRSRSLCGSVD